MAIEIERKYLVDRRKWRSQVYLEAFAVKDIQQGYLSRSNHHTIRVRIVSEPNDTKSYITIKGKAKGISRDEFEYEIPTNDAIQLMQMCDSSLRKKRHYLQHAGHEWVVDEYEGMNKGLLVAEIELQSEDEQYSLPDWIKTDITHDKRYTNSYLSAHKAPKE